MKELVKKSFLLSLKIFGPALLLGIILLAVFGDLPPLLISLKNTNQAFLLKFTIEMVD